ncbi:hypothetical protein GCM10020000_60300 [Streptomyces olivoverticillatus]
MNADGLLVPGVGAFAACMEGLRAARGDWIVGRRLSGGRPVMGICVGMQILFERGIEHGVETDGLDEWPGTVEPLKADVVPHMGWNTVTPAEGSRLFAGLDADARYYFVHSYAVREWQLEVGNPNIRAPQGHLGHARRALRRGGRERAAVGHPVPPREVRRRGSGAADQLDRDALMPTLELLPAVDVRDGQAVRLVHGESGSETSYGDPLSAALAWQRAGAEWLHLVDLDAAFGTGDNRAQVAEIVRTMGIKVELSGGIRDDASLAAALATGCTRVNLGTAALETPRVGRQGHRRARRPHRRRPGRPRHHPARPRLDQRRRRPLRDPGPPGLRGLRPLRRHRHRQGRHAPGPQPGAAEERLRRHRQARRGLRWSLLS